MATVCTSEPRCCRHQAGTWIGTLAGETPSGTPAQCGGKGTTEASLGATWRPPGAEPRPGVHGRLELVGGLGGLVLAAQGLQGQAGSAGAHVPHELPEKGAGQATPGVPRGTLAVGRGSAFVLRALSAFL